MSKTIQEFKRYYHFLSNFHYHAKDETVEHLYQASKTIVPKEKKKILEADSPRKAKELGQLVTIRKDIIWECWRRTIMFNFVLDKFARHGALKKKLLATGDAILIEGNYWHDNYWGDCHCDDCKDKEGQNYLGKILMEVREYLSGSKV